MTAFLKLFLIFIFYSFVGYILEVIVCSVEKRKFVNRGFLVGPIIPLYGVGTVLLIMTLERYIDYPEVVFVFGMVITSGVEYLTSYVLEKIFHNKWWDYSHRKDSINGRICLGNSLFFGIMALVVVCYFQPILDGFINNFSNFTIILVGSIALILFIADLLFSLAIAYELRSSIIVVENLKEMKIKRVSDALEKQLTAGRQKIKLASNRFVKAFPNLNNFDTIKAINEWYAKQVENSKSKKVNKKQK